MGLTLGGIQFVRCGVKYDYCFEESISNLKSFCDRVMVVVIHAGEEEDGTVDKVINLSTLGNGKINCHIVSEQVWRAYKGKEKLAFFQNVAIECLDTDYIYLQQADEVTTEDSIPFIREAMQFGHDGYLVERVNLWGSPNTQLDVPHNRKPCSTSVIRLTKRQYRSYDDGENIGAPAVMDFHDKIKIIHYGFVRSKKVHADKIRQMQRDIFLVTPDSKLEGMELFDGSKWFSTEDLIPIQFRHPKVMEKWVEEHSH